MSNSGATDIDPEAANEFGPQPWACRLRVAARWTVKLANGALFVRRRHGKESRSVLDTTAEYHRGWFWSRVRLHGAESPIDLHGLSHTDAQRLTEALLHHRQAAIDNLERNLQTDWSLLEPLRQDLNTRTNVARYLTARERAEIERHLRGHETAIEAAYARACSPHSAKLAIATPVRQVTESLRQIIAHLAVALDNRNQRFVKQELERWRGLFDHCEERPLTDEQAEAVITFEENTLLVAAAGSGKTSTVVAKVAYALAKGIARPEEVLCLAFNDKAAKEIGARIRMRLTAMTQPGCPIDPTIKETFAAILKSSVKIESRTFHSLGKSIIKTVENRSTRVSNRWENENRLKRAIESCHRDPHFTANWLLLRTVARFARPADSRFRTEEEYLDYLRSIWRQRKFGHGDDRKAGIQSLGCDKLVRSFDEVAISNWLYVMGVAFDYEAPFARGAERLCPGKDWMPDFTYRVRDAQGERVIVHEHFALNAEGNAPAYFDDPGDYRAKAKGKQKVLLELDTCHFWTTSAQYLDGTLFVELEARLRAAGVEFQPRSQVEVIQRLEKIDQNEDMELIEQAVSQIRQNGWDLSVLEARIAEQPEPARARLFLDVVWPVAREVNRLLEEDKQLDFDEMIRRALGYLNKRPDLLSFRFILVDEFQDMAPGRGELLRQMLHARAESLFFAVGDDWQAINRFAGSDLRFFHQFGQRFNRRANANARCDLTQTFRSNQGIADVARQFVCRNTSQLRKNVIAQDKTTDGVIDVRLYRDDRDVMQKVEEALGRWVLNHSGAEKPSVLLLGRYGETHVCGLSKDQIKELNERWADRIELRPATDRTPATMYLTMHKSKGLQADYVLILGLFRVEHDWFCFPSEREDDPLMQLVLPPKEAMADADERRLFYVALTRARHQVVVLATERHTSRYALDLLRDYRDGEILFNGSSDLPPVCPKCNQGLVFPRYNPRDASTFYACSDRYGCGQRWNTWPPKPPTAPGLPGPGRRTTYGVGGKSRGPGAGKRPSKATRPGRYSGGS